MGHGPWWHDRLSDWLSKYCKAQLAGFLNWSSVRAFTAGHGCSSANSPTETRTGSRSQKQQQRLFSSWSNPFQASVVVLNSRPCLQPSLSISPCICIPNPSCLLLLLGARPGPPAAGWRRRLLSWAMGTRSGVGPWLAATSPVVELLLWPTWELFYFRSWKKISVNNLTQSIINYN